MQSGVKIAGKAGSLTINLRYTLVLQSGAFYPHMALTIDILEQNLPKYLPLPYKTTKFQS